MSVSGFKNAEDEILDRLRDVEKNIAVIQADISNIKETNKDLASCFKVLNEHHLDSQNELNEVKTTLITLKNTIMIGFTIIGSVIGIMVFLVEYVFK